MDLKPLASYPRPKYPYQREIRKDSRLLMTVPGRWKKKPTVMTALMLTLSTGLSACASSTGAAASSQMEASEASVSAAAPSETVFSGKTPELASDPEAPSAADGGGLASTVIPVFEHGEGRGSYGCMSVAPPVFLSEEEALQVIREEAAAMGISFTEKKTISGTFPATSLDPFADAPETAVYDGDLELDGYDSALGIGVEFVSQQDVEDWVKPGDGMSSVNTYDMLGTAQRLNQAAPGVAVFYDPTSQDYDAYQVEFPDNDGTLSQTEYEARYLDFMEKHRQQYIEEQREYILEDLRAQVRDFLRWLAAQGVI